jgi:hypothetical protein
MARISMPVESGNRAIKDGTLGAVVQRAAERWKPEATAPGSDVPDPFVAVPR